MPVILTFKPCFDDRGAGAARHGEESPRALVPEQTVPAPHVKGDGYSGLALSIHKAIWFAVGNHSFSGSSISLVLYCNVVHDSCFPSWSASKIILCYAKSIRRMDSTCYVMIHGSRKQSADVLA